MLRTPYSALPVDDLLNFVLNRDNSTDMEIELAQRLMLAMDMLHENEELSPPPRPPYGHNA